MVSQQEIKDQLKKIGFNSGRWNRAEVAELPHIILPDEEIYECVNGMYEGGFALLVATNVRVLLIDKKPLNYLTVEDLRFDMINQMDYSHRLIGAEIKVSSGNKNLKFRSYNQQRLRKLIGHVQNCMAEIKSQISTHQDSQASHLEQINRQLSAYLASQHQYQLQMQQISSQPNNTNNTVIPEPPKPSNELADYLYAQSLLAKYNSTNQNNPLPVAPINPIPVSVERPLASNQVFDQNLIDTKEIYNEGLREVFGDSSRPTQTVQASSDNKLEINPIQIAYSKLPMALRNKKFGSRTTLGGQAA